MTLLIPLIDRREIAMDLIISNLVAFEKGSLSRRELVQGLAMLAASGTAATAQEDINFKAANIDHVSVQVTDLQRSLLSEDVRVYRSEPGRRGRS
jgi:hypothetical protein